MDTFRLIVVRLLYLTPFGYLRDTLLLLGNKKINGVNVNLGRNSPITAEIKDQATLNSRAMWLINGIVLLLQAAWILVKNIGGTLGGTYALVALIYGLVAIVSAVFPRIQWNKKLL